MKTVETVSFILLREDKILVERRRIDRVNDPGALVVPGGHIEPGESHVDAVKRELNEELGIQCNKLRYYERMLCKSDTEYQLNSWYICEDWIGEPKATEAEEILYLTKN